MGIANTLKCFSTLEDVDFSKSAIRAVTLQEITLSMNATCSRLIAKPTKGFEIANECVPENTLDIYTWFSNAIYYGLQDIRVEFSSDDMVGDFATVYFDEDNCVNVSSEPQDLPVANKLVMNTLGSVYFYLNSIRL